MSLYRFLFGIRAQLVYCLALAIFIVAASSYLFNITSIQQAYFETRGQVLSVVLMAKNLKLPHPKIVDNAYAPTHTAPSATPTPSASPSPATVVNPDTQLVNCTGPDGKTLWLTQKDCDNFNNAWKGIHTPTSEATASATTN